MKSITITDIEENSEVKTYIKACDDAFASIDFKEHGFRHAKLASNISGNVLKFLGFCERDIELAKISGYLHDIGNSISLNDHPRTGGLLCLKILKNISMETKEIYRIINAISSHEDKKEVPSCPLSAALILGDKTDVHSTRVRKDPKVDVFNTHDRVNYACQRAFLRVESELKIISLELTINTEIIDIMEYFEIFLSRLMQCRNASKFFDCQFVLYINKNKFL